MESGLKRPRGNELCRRLHPNDSRNPFSFTVAPQGVMVWGRGTAQRRSGALVYPRLETHFLALFHTASTLSGSLRSPPFPHGEGFVSRKAVSSYRSLPHWGRGTASAVDRVLSLMAHLRRSPSLFFIPLEPYPARSARHLPHAGKALSVVILFLHVSCIRFDDVRKAASSYRSLPHWGRGTAQRWIGCSRKRHT